MLSYVAIFAGSELLAVLWGYLMREKTFNQIDSRQNPITVRDIPERGMGEYAAEIQQPALPLDLLADTKVALAVDSINSPLVLPLDVPRPRRKSDSAQVSCDVG
jgi:hypothetical protein